MTAAKQRGRATDTLIKKATTVVVGEEEIVINTFCFAKTVMAFTYITELVEAANVEDTLLAAASGDTLDEEGTAAMSGFITQLIRLIPRALRKGTPTIYKLIGLVATGNAQLQEMEETDGIDVDAELYKVGKSLSYKGTPEQMLTLLTQSVSVMGVETVIEAVGPLVARMIRR